MQEEEEEEEEEEEAEEVAEAQPRKRESSRNTDNSIDGVRIQTAEDTKAFEGDIADNTLISSICKTHNVKL